jgi:hypothetical protein
MNDTVEILLNNSNTATTIESLCRARQHLKDSVLLEKLDMAIERELYISILNSEELLKVLAPKVADVVPIK